MILEQALLDKLRLIETLHAGAATDGERAAAASARGRILDRLRTMQVADPPIEYRFSARDEWSMRLLVALLRRYEIRPYRYPRQRYTTVMARVPVRFVDETLWPEFCELGRTLRTYLDEVTARIIQTAITTDNSDVEVRSAPLGLAGGDAAGGGREMAGSAGA